MFFRQCYHSSPLLLAVYGLLVYYKEQLPLSIGLDPEHYLKLAKQLTLIVTSKFRWIISLEPDFGPIAPVWQLFKLTFLKVFKVSSTTQIAHQQLHYFNSKYFQQILLFLLDLGLSSHR